MKLSTHVLPGGIDTLVKVSWFALAPEAKLPPHAAPGFDALKPDGMLIVRPATATVAPLLVSVSFALSIPPTEGDSEARVSDAE
ncbi:hypothetical protein HT746_00785 [Burkholderia pyrrocinia]|uniref:hypothetical protein n=1 Tax=Burkholderia pyrrocinia TaxID=60550 RepID=UPI0015760BBA|nr:hypothetical protein [Burkholderia pyrrocinia]NTX25701.1 hypothetical protein [Burkholderia pyrrocinia]